MSLFKRAPKEPPKDAKYIEQVMQFFFQARNFRDDIIDPKYEPFIKALWEANEKSQTKTIAAAAEWITDPKTPDDLYIVAEAWVYAGAANRPQAIKYLEQYISSGALAYHLRKNNNQQGYEANIYDQLGDCYYGEAMYEKAIDAYNKEISLVPQYGYPYLHLAKVYTKLNEYDSAVSLLTDARKIVNNSEKTVIDEKLIKIQATYIKDLEKQLGIKKK